MKNLLIPLFLMIFGFGFSQNSNLQNRGDYLVVDLSKTIPGNEIHDRLYYLTQWSESVQLPEDVVAFIDNIQDEPGLHHKLSWLRSSIMKIIYNPRISPEDKKFVCNHYLQTNDNQTGQINQLLRDYLNKN